MFKENSNTYLRGLSCDQEKTDLAVFLTPDQMAISKFLKSTHEQVERFQEVKKYSKKLMAFKVAMAKEGIQSTFSMYEILSVKILCPIRGIEVRVLLREYNYADILLTSPTWPYTILFENCETGVELIRRMREAKLLHTREQRELIARLDSSLNDLNNALSEKKSPPEEAEVKSCSLSCGPSDWFGKCKAMGCNKPSFGAFANGHGDE